MKFLGTSAGEGIPDPFCTCPICENARRVGGKELRTRSSFLLDEETIIDLGADYFAQARDHGLRLDKLRTVLLTHTHDDHFNYTFFWERSVKRAGTGEPLTVILSEEGKRYFDEFYVRSPALGSERLLSPPNAVLRAVKPGVPFEAGPYRVTPLRGRHSTAFEKNSTNYLVERNGESLYYALDSGYFTEETFEALRGRRLTYFIGECTFPVDFDYMTRESGHMDKKRFVENLDRLYEIGTIDEKTKIYATHISPFGSTHETLSAFFASLDRPYRAEAAYDGLELPALG